MNSEPCETLGNTLTTFAKYEQTIHESNRY